MRDSLPFLPSGNNDENKRYNGMYCRRGGRVVVLDMLAVCLDSMLYTDL
jgi:hypothetical protein